MVQSKKTEKLQPQQVATKIDVQPSEEVEKAVAAELDIDDPSPEKAKAILEQKSEDEDDRPTAA